MATKVYESLMHCNKCGNWKWWFKGEFPVCSECYPPPEPTELQEMSYVLRIQGERMGILDVGKRLSEESKEIYIARRKSTENK